MKNHIESINVIVPSGYKAVEFGRVIRKGQMYLGYHAGEISICTWDSNSPSCNNHVLVEKTFEWPDWLICDYITQDNNGEWYGYDRYPCVGAITWIRDGGLMFRIIPSMLNIELPEFDKWQDSMLCRKHYV